MISSPKWVTNPVILRAKVLHTKQKVHVQNNENKQTTKQQNKKYSFMFREITTSIAYLFVPCVEYLGSSSS